MNKLTFFALLLPLACACQNQTYHYPLSTAWYFLSVKVTPAAGKTAPQAVKELVPVLKERVEGLGIVYRSIAAGEAPGTVQLELIGSKWLSQLPADERLDTLKKSLLQTTSLEFWNTYRISDAGIAPAMLEVMKMLPEGKLLELNDSQQFGSACMGIASPHYIAQVDSVLRMPEAAKLFPADLVFMWSQHPIAWTPYEEKTGAFELFALKKKLPGSYVVSGEMLISAKPEPNLYTGEMDIRTKFNEEGTRLWADMTDKAARDQNREVAIVVNGRVSSAPSVINAITTGDSVISAAYTVEEAKGLAAMLQLGVLGHQLEIVEAK